MNKHEIGKYLEKLRKNKGLNRTEAANAIGTIYKSILDWESGVMPSNESLVKLARLYDVTVDDILECGLQITNEELYEKYPVFKPFDYKGNYDKKKDYYTPYQTQLLIINTRLKKLITLFRKRILSRCEDSELRFLFTNMCSFSDYYYERFDDEHKDKYLCFIEVLNRAKDHSQSFQEYYFEVKKYIDVVNYGYNNPFPEYAKPEIDNIKDQQFKTLEDWEKDFYLALVQNSDVIADPSHNSWFLKDYEQRYGEHFDKETIVKKLIKYFIDSGAKVNPWLCSYIKKKKITHNILETLEDSYIDYLKPIFIHYYNPNNDDGEPCYAHVENNEQNRFLDNYIQYSMLPLLIDRVSPKKMLELFALDDEKEIVEFLYSKRKKYRKEEETEYRFKKADVKDDLESFYKCKEKLIADKKLAENKLKQIKELETRFEQGETTFFEYVLEDITEGKEFDHWALMTRWKNQLTYPQFLKKRDKELTQSLLNDLDNLSLEEIRRIYFVKEEVEVKDE